MIRHLNILLSVFLIALAGGCNNEDSGILNSEDSPQLAISFIDSEGRDLVTGIPTIKLVDNVGVERPDDYLSSDIFRVKMFANEEELPTHNHYLYIPTIYKDERYDLYHKVCFVFLGLFGFANDKNNVSVCTVRCEVVCPYIFGNDETHILTAELSRDYPGGYSYFQRFWFDGVEIPFGVYPPGLDMTYPEDGRKPTAYFVQVDR
jgi:hypothetical protein